MKQKHLLRVITVLLAVCMLTLSSTSAMAMEARWENTTSRDSNNNIVIDFAELQIILPADWGGKVQMNISNDYVSFYHIKSREKWTEELGYANGGHLFTLNYTTDYSYTETQPSYMTIGCGSDGIYYASFPTDLQAYTGDTDTYNEYLSLANDLSWIEANMTISVSVITILDNEYIFPQSADSYLSRSDLDGMTADEVQMAINEIYARHHRKFILQDVQAYFDAKSWYSGTIEAEDFDVSVMNVYEGANINLMVERLAELSS